MRIQTAFTALLISVLFGHSAEAEEAPTVNKPIIVDADTSNAFKSTLNSLSEGDGPLKVCSSRNVERKENGKLSIEVNELYWGTCSVIADSDSVVEPTAADGPAEADGSKKELYTAFSSIRSRTRHHKNPSTSESDDKYVFRTTHVIDLSYSGVPYRDKPAENGSFSFDASLRSSMGDGELYLSSGYFKNRSDNIYRTQFVPDGFSFGAGVWLKSSEKKSSDVGFLVRGDYKKNCFLKSALPIRCGAGGNVYGKDTVLGMSSPFTATLGGNLSLRHGQTAHDTATVTLHGQRSWLDSGEQLPSNISSLLLGVSVSRQLPWPGSIYLELGAALLYGFSDPMNPDSDDSVTKHRVSAAVVFRKPGIVEKSGLEAQWDYNHLTRLGGSAFSHNFWDSYSFGD